MFLKLVLQSNLLLTQCGDGRSFWYILANSHMQTSAYEHFNDTRLHMVGMQTLHSSAY